MRKPKEKIKDRIRRAISDVSIQEWKHSEECLCEECMAYWAIGSENVWIDDDDDWDECWEEWKRR